MYLYKEISKRHRLIKLDHQLVTSEGHDISPTTAMPEADHVPEFKHTKTPHKHPL